MMEKQRSSEIAGALAAKTARSCDSCLRRRARWFCAADDAFLCQSCDNSVHSANTLARRHHRVRLNTASSSKPPMLELDTTTTPAWLHGLKRKARTPRGKLLATSDGLVTSKVEPLVPDLEENQHSCDEEQLLYHVPMIDPIDAEFCPQKLRNHMTVSSDEPKQTSVQLKECNQEAAIVADSDGLAEFHQTDVELSDFVADMETLLGGGIDQESFGINSLGLLDEEGSSKSEELKVELELGDMEINLSRENIDLDFNYAPQELPKDFEGRQLFVQTPTVSSYGPGNTVVPTSEPWKKILKLDYETIITEWSSNGSSPWIDGQRPSLTPNFFSDFTGMWGSREMHEQFGIFGHETAINELREARVTRYREKRRTRLFSKKIRYEVRKLNAEKRPRMKGRFVKSATFPVAGTAPAPSSFVRSSYK